MCRALSEDGCKTTSPACQPGSLCGLQRHQSLLHRSCRAEGGVAGLVGLHRADPGPHQGDRGAVRAARYADAGCIPYSRVPNEGPIPSSRRSTQTRCEPPAAHHRDRSRLRCDTALRPVEGTLRPGSYSGLPISSRWLPEIPGRMARLGLSQPGKSEPREPREEQQRNFDPGPFPEPSERPSSLTL